MPRAARKKSETGIYHIMFRGINKQNIFNEPYDYRKALELIIKSRNKSNFQLFAYCFMPNHIHLLIKEGEQPVSNALKSFGTSYATWFNTKYARVGHLFQDRYRSEPVEDEAYFYVVMRYILQNPVKAGMVKSVGDYPYSSYADFFGQGSVIDCDFPLSLQKKDAWNEFINADTDVKCMDMNQADVKRLTHEQAEDIFRKITQCESSGDFQCLSLEEQRKLIVNLKRQGLSVRQVSNLTGWTCYAVQKRTE